MKDDEFSRGTTDMTTASGNLSHAGDAGNSSTKPQSPTLSEMPFTEKLKRKKDFPWKLHKMLEEVEQRGMSGVISWDTDGTSFKVHQPEVFVKDIMPKYFNQTLFRSFQRMLNLYNFQKLISGTYRGGYVHPKFQRDNKELSLEMRIRPKGPSRAAKHNKRRQESIQIDADFGMFLPMIEQQDTLNTPEKASLLRKRRSTQPDNVADASFSGSAFSSCANTNRAREAASFIPGNQSFLPVPAKSGDQTTVGSSSQRSFGQDSSGFVQRSMDNFNVLPLRNFPAELPSNHANEKNSVPDIYRDHQKYFHPSMNFGAANQISADKTSQQLHSPSKPLSYQSQLDQNTGPMAPLDRRTMEEALDQWSFEEPLCDEFEPTPLPN